MKRESKRRLTEGLAREYALLDRWEEAYTHSRQPAVCERLFNARVASAGEQDWVLCLAQA